MHCASLCYACSDEFTGCHGGDAHTCVDTTAQNCLCAMVRARSRLRSCACASYARLCQLRDACVGRLGGAGARVDTQWAGIFGAIARVDGLVLAGWLRASDIGDKGGFALI